LHRSTFEIYSFLFEKYGLLTVIDNLLPPNEFNHISNSISAILFFKNDTMNALQENQFFKEIEKKISSEPVEIEWVNFPLEKTENMCNQIDENCFVSVEDYLLNLFGQNRE
jgi:hypothetical protein